jgi:hypothetical protein
MKITQRQLRQIIQEELSLIAEGLSYPLTEIRPAAVSGGNLSVKHVPTGRTATSAGIKIVHVDEDKKMKEYPITELAVVSWKPGVPEGSPILTLRVTIDAGLFDYTLDKNPELKNRAVLSNVVGAIFKQKRYATPPVPLADRPGESAYFVVNPAASATYDPNRD